MENRDVVELGCKAIAHRDRNEFGQAIQLFDLAIEAYCNDFLLNERGVTYSKMLRPEDAVRDFDRAIEQNPFVARYFLNRGNALFRLGRLDEAVDDFNAAIDREPLLAQGYNSRGVAYEAKNELENAKNDFERSISIDGNYLSPRYNLGRLHARLGSIVKAITELEKAQRVAPNDSDVPSELACLYFLSDRFADAKQCFESAIAKNKRNAHALSRFAILLALSGDGCTRDYSRAISLAKQAIDLRPDVPAFVQNLAVAYAASGQFETAIKTQDMAIDLCRSQPSRVERKEWREKIEAQRDSIQFAPSLLFF